jgi:uncharacterized membrane protein
VKRLLLPLALFAVIHIVIFSVVFDWGVYGDEGPSDVYRYFNYASRIVDGELPYRDFDVEYPPLSLVSFVGPRLFTESPSVYADAFMVEMLLLNLAGLVLVAALARRLGQSPWATLGIYTVGLLAVGPIIGERYDLLPAVLVLATLYAFISGHHRLAWAALALATMAKLYPVVIAPLFIIFYLSRRQYRQAGEGVGVFAATTAAVVLPALALSASGFWDSFTYHAERGIQIESTWGSILLLGQTLGASPVELSFDHGSLNVVSPASDAFAALSVVLMAALLLLVYALYAQKRLSSASAGDQEDAGGIINYSLLAVLAFMITSKVFSPQYIVWLYPLVPLVVGQWRNACWVLFVVIGALTRYIFPAHYAELTRGQEGVINLLVWRNALLGLLAFLLMEWKGVFEGIAWPWAQEAALANAMGGEVDEGSSSAADAQ